MLTSYNTIIYFFVNNFFPNVYISVNTIFECTYLSFGWEIGHPLSIYVARGMERGHPKRREGCHASCVRTHLHYLFSCFCNMVSFFICRNLVLRHIVQYICAILFTRFFWNKPTSETVTLNAYICLQGRQGVEKLVLRYVRTKWMSPNKCCGIFFVHWYDQVNQSITSSKENVVLFFHHNYNNFILRDN